MTDNRQEEHYASPTGLVIHEPEFPNISSNPLTPGEITKLKLSEADEAGLNSIPTVAQANQPEQKPSVQNEQVQSDLQSSRPLQQRSATERPKPSAKESWFGRVHSKPPGAQLNRPTTITFDAETSESESSSSDEDDHRRLGSGRDDALSRQDSRQKRRTNPGPSSRVKVANEHFKSSGRISKSDGRLKLNFLEKDKDGGYLAKTLGAVWKKHSSDGDPDNVRHYDEDEGDAHKIAPEDDEMEHEPSRRVKLNIVIIIIGSRGDIQPFIRIGKILQNDYGHRVRMATHPAFRDFVEKDSGLEFFSIGGNPAELMAFMVKNPGLLPGFDTIKEGEIGRRRAQMYEMFNGMWRACINASDDEKDKANLHMLGDNHPFVADAIIANPPSFAPPHIAEKLGIPLHMMFTFPYTPTVHFPHPLANIKSSNIEATYGNFMSYPLVEMMTWQGLGDLINRFRKDVLYLEEVSTLWAPGQLYRLKVPYTYMWSPSLIPKPKDWGTEIDVTGFVFLDLASSFTPPDDLKTFLDKGDPPVYIGFGSIVVDDPDEFTEMIFEAVKIAGCRALVSKGWGGFGSNSDCPDNIFMLENTPHDWLFPRCSAVVHHGGAGTTAIGLKTARPTMIVPFFGDQPFWGAMVSKAKAGAHECIPYKKLNAQRLAEGIKQCLTEEARVNVKKIADSIEKEGDGALNAVRSFHQSLPLRGAGSMRCDFIDNKTAAWKIKKTKVKLSPLAAEILVEHEKIKWNELRLLRHFEWNDFQGSGEPITGLWGTLMSTMFDVTTGVGGLPVEMSKSVQKRQKIKVKKRAIRKRRQHEEATLARVNSKPAETPTEAVDEGKGKNGRPKAKREESSLSGLQEPQEALTEELAQEAGDGFRKTSGAIVRLPMNIALALTQGFHNAPRLYGDETVRRPHRVTGFHSGLRAGRDELVYGVRDGITGVVTQPIRMAKQDGILGAAQGVGFGIGGLVLKNIAAAIGPSAYFLKGLDAEYMKRYQPTNYLRRVRIAQGQLEMKQLGTEEGMMRLEIAEDGTEKKTPVNKEAVEQQVTHRWGDLKKSMDQEKTSHRSGIVNSLLGRDSKKTGQNVPRKSKEHPREEQPSKAATTPAPVPTSKDGYQGDHKKQSENKKSKEEKLGKPKRSMDSSTPGLNRSSTAPTTILVRQHGDTRKLFNRSQEVSHSQATSQGAVNDTLQTAHKFEESKNFSNTQLVDGEKPEHDHLAVDREQPDRNHSADASSDVTKVESSVDRVDDKIPPAGDVSAVQSVQVV